MHWPRSSRPTKTDGGSEEDEEHAEEEAMKDRAQAMPMPRSGATYVADLTIWPGTAKVQQGGAEAREEMDKATTGAEARDPQEGGQPGGTIL